MSPLRCSRMPRGSVRRASGLVLTAKPYLCRDSCKPSIHLSRLTTTRQLARLISDVLRVTSLRAQDASLELR